MVSGKKLVICDAETEYARSSCRVPWREKRPVITGKDL